MEFLLLVVAAVLLWLFVATYNKLQKLGNEVKRFRGDVAAALKKRSDLVGRLIDIAKSYGDHEKLTQIGASTRMGEMAGGAPDMENASRLFSGLAMAFPELKANATYQQLMSQLHEIEGNLQARREQYNQVASQYNSYRASLPQALFASAVGFPEAPYFTVDENGMDVLPEFRTDDGLILKEGLQNLGARTSAMAQTAGQKLSQARKELEARQAAEAAEAAAAQEPPPPGATQN
ncbi:LemA family protein [Phenylobacterium sp.]|uniref:LemA family protein n=1 Tax=Phenylobacterium sp. TaxID=1871053 RepID=UPI002604E0F6|nr:LemA family protein [Phenylobacterium sp.]